jgi:hypothetical protein
MNTSQSSSTSGGTATAQPPLSQTARETAAQVGAAARQTVSQATDKAAQYAAERKATVADRVQAYGSAMHDSAKSLEPQDPNIAWFAHQAAERLERAASYVRESDFSTMKADAENLARRHPAAFFGGLCVAGLILGSVIKASARRAADDTGSAGVYPDESASLSDAAPVPAAQI